MKSEYGRIILPFVVLRRLDCVLEPQKDKAYELYEKYKKDGFTIMSVSLDKDLKKWKQAIELDNLSWPNHVSDLGGWQSKVSRLYQVGSVPFTVLIDQEGKIIKTNLRGPALESELEKIFGH